MNREQRLKLQSYVDTLEDKLLRLPFVSEIRISGYIDDYIEIQLIPERLIYYNIPLSTVISVIKANNCSARLSHDELVGVKCK